MNGWIGVDLDGTLAHYDGWHGVEHIGEPIGTMVDRVKSWLAEGNEVRIFTARVWAPPNADPMVCNQEQCDYAQARQTDAKKATEVIEKWCEEHIGTKLRVTCEKDFGMIALWDDRCVQVKINTGEPVAA